MAILRSQGLIRKKGTVADLVRMLGGQKAVRINHPTRVDKGPPQA